MINEYNDDTLFYKVTSPQPSAPSIPQSDTLISIAIDDEQDLNDGGHFKKPKLEIFSDDTSQDGSLSSLILEDVVHYKPINYHWFYTCNVSGKQVWIPMSNKDSAKLEKSFLNNK
jgi:hypothetical protein